MPTASGIAAQFGCAAETTWGVFQTPTRFLELVSESLNLQVQRLESAALRASTRYQRSDRWTANKKGVAGDVSFEVSSKGFGLLFKHWLGTVSTGTAPGGTTSKRHRCTIGDPFGLGLTVQIGRPDNTGVVNPFSYLGCKIVSGSLSNSVDGYLMFNATVDGADESTSSGLAAASYAASDELLNFTGGALTMNSVAVATVRDITITAAVGLNTGRYGIRSSTLKKEPIADDFVLVTGTITSEFESLTAYNRYVNGTTTGVVATWTGATALEGAIFPQVVATMPVCRFDGDTPNLSGKSMLTQTLPFKALYDGSQEPLTVDYITLDATP